MDRLLAGAAALGLAALGAGLGWRLVAAARDRYRHLLAAVEQLGRQATDLRTEVDRLQERVERVDQRLATRIQPEVGRLARALALEQAAAAVRRGLGEGHLPSETAERLLAHLADLGAASLAGEPDA